MNSIVPQQMALHGGRLHVDVKPIEVRRLGHHATEKRPQRLLDLRAVADHEPRVDARARTRCH